MLKSKRLRVSKLITYFVLADLLLLGGWGLVSPILSIFIVEEIIGATLVTVGAATAISWLIRSIIQLPVGNFLDKGKGEKDDFYTLLFSLVLVALTGFGLALIETVNQLYLLWAVHGTAFGVYTVAWTSIFSRHLDRRRLAFDWSLDRAAAGIAMAISGFLGAEAASRFGFDSTFIAAGILSLATAGILLAVPSLILPRPKTKEASLGPEARHRHRLP